MQVETYYCDEIASEPTEACERASELIQKFGMAGQKALTSSVPSNGRFPFPEMTKEEALVYQVLCPEHISMESYQNSAIPLRVLECIDLAFENNSTGVFDEIQIWDKTSSVVKDPVAVAVSGNIYSSDRRLYILARWGAELETWATLVERAYEQARESMRADLTRLASIAQSGLSRLDSMPLETMIDGIDFWKLEKI